MTGVARLAVVLGVCLSFSEASEVAGRIVLQKDLGKASIAPITYDLRGLALGESTSNQRPVNKFERVAVWLESDGPAAVEPVTVTMRQRNRHFEPELLVVPVGSTVEFPNLDFIFHNIFSLSRTQAFDLGYYPKGQSRSVTFRHPGIVQVYCHVHANMHGAIVVTSSRWFGKPAEDGAFVFANVPRGKYRLMVWQRFGGLYQKNIEVQGTEGVKITMTVPEQDEDRP
jgi:plastocyanin